MNCERRGVAVGERIGERGSCAAGARHVEAAAGDRMPLRFHAADKSAPIEQRADKTSLGFAPDGIDHLRIDAVAFQAVAQPRRLALCGAVTMNPSRLNIHLSPAQPRGRSSRPIWTGKHTASI